MSALPPPGTRYVHYARYSTDHQTFKSIEDQQTLCRAYAERQGWVEVGAYYDVMSSGATTICRADLFQMLAAVDHGAFAVILVEDLDQLSRSASGIHGILEELEAQGVAVHTVVGGVFPGLEVAFRSAMTKARDARSALARHGRPQSRREAAS